MLYYISIKKSIYILLSGGVFGADPDFITFSRDLTLFRDTGLTAKVSVVSDNCILIISENLISA